MSRWIPVIIAIVVVVSICILAVWYATLPAQTPPVEAQPPVVTDTPPPAADTDVARAADDDIPPELAIPLPPPEEEEGVDLTPAHVSREDFDAVFDEVIDACGMGVWSEVERACTEVRCGALLVSPSDPSQPYPTLDVFTGCQVWQDRWGTRPEFIQTSVDCEDGVQLDIAYLGPSTLRMRELIAQGRTDELLVPPAVLQQRACETWGAD